MDEADNLSLPRAVYLRPAKHSDYRFALELYLATMRPLTSQLMNWDEGKQRASFQRLWQVEQSRVIRCRNQDVGWIQAQERPGDILFQQFFISSEHHGRGLGSEVLRLLVAEWDSLSKPVTLTVLRNNPAWRLYQRFGFVVVDEVGVKLLMRRSVPM